MRLVKVLFSGWMACQALGLLAQSASKDASLTAAQTERSVDQPIVYTPGDGITAPKLIYYRDPEYTDPARRKKLSGTTVLSLVVDTSGNPEQVQVVQSLAEGLKPKLKKAAESLDRSAVETVEQYRFEPSTKDGQPVAVQIKVQVNFRLY